MGCVFTKHGTRKLSPIRHWTTKLSGHLPLSTVRMMSIWPGWSWVRHVVFFQCECLSCIKTAGCTQRRYQAHPASFHSLSHLRCLSFVSFSLPLSLSISFSISLFLVSFFFSLFLHNIYIYIYISLSLSLSLSVALCLSCSRSLALFLTPLPPPLFFSASLLFLSSPPLFSLTLSLGCHSACRLRQLLIACKDTSVECRTALDAMINDANWMHLNRTQTNWCRHRLCIWLKQALQVPTDDHMRTLPFQHC